ncbi:hypothetical protein HELRODRAFT_153603, partial [Helobdella robusta]|uniref:RING-type domain-containing protein n=1 Tax=Helobdella robusta TaxID=6412 RepID=T1EL92_HELRO
ADGTFLNSECPICLEDFLLKSFIYEIPCRHAIHVNCATKWFKLRGVCPLCVQSV